MAFSEGGVSAGLCCIVLLWLVWLVGIAGLSVDGLGERRMADGGRAIQTSKFTPWIKPAWEFSKMRVVDIDGDGGFFE